jgi:serine/threonine protein kinase
MADAPFEGPQVSHLFPYINSYSINGNEVRFKYLQRLKPERTSSVFKAQVLDDSKFIVVKFVRRYNEEAHALLANFNLAPQLYYVEPEPQQSFATGQILVRRPRMIVMEYVDGDSPRDAFYHEKPPQNFFDDINEAIEKLHQKDLVFGDLRGPNIIVGERGNVKLIDFDWCGEAGKARYPPDLNDSSTIGWHPGVKKQGLMEKEHDVWMQDVLNGYAPLD